VADSGPESAGKRSDRKSGGGQGVRTGTVATEPRGTKEGAVEG
jgi:ribosomal protein L27